MNTNQILQVTAFAGKIILENGGETYRVEETMKRICISLGVKQVDSYVTPTGIIISISDNNTTNSIVKRITSRTVNLEKVSMVNDLSRKVSKENLPLKKVKKELEYIDKYPTYNKNILLIFSGLAAAFFSLLFGGTIKDFFVSFFIGIVIKLLCTSLYKIKTNEFFVNAICGIITALLAAGSVQLNLADNIDKTIIGSIMLLVPGISITNAIRDTIAGDIVSGVTRAVESIFIAVAIALGTGFALKLWFNIFGGLI
ncbi:threonine/serine exporter family protein [Clostridium sediminicola]|uniref:threonine/serine exporter family protein n=1 Tax=Clostridium sediminicola TaxID=3114879 RepID=UPI0031F2554C